jgi:hypothetical protein
LSTLHIHGILDLLEDFRVILEVVFEVGGGKQRIDSSILIGNRILKVEEILSVGSSMLTVNRILSGSEILIGGEV